MANDQPGRGELVPRTSDWHSVKNDMDNQPGGTRQQVSGNLPNDLRAGRIRIQLGLVAIMLLLAACGRAVITPEPAKPTASASPCTGCTPTVTRAAPVTPQPSVAATATGTATPLPFTPTAVMPAVPLAGAAIIGAMFDPAEIATYCSTMSSHGIHAVTLTIQWQAVEPRKGTYQFAKIDQVVQQARSCGLAIGAHVNAKSNWATVSPPQGTGNDSKQASMPPTSMDDYGDFISNLAKHYRGVISRYSIENEAASPANWGSTPDEYAKLLGTAYRAVKAVDPAALVLTDGMSSTGLSVLVASDLLQYGKPEQAVSFLQTAYAHFAPGRRGANPVQINSADELRTFLQQPVIESVQNWITMLAANQASYDAFQVHYYGPPDQLPVVMNYIHRRLRQQGSDRPIELWELGYGWDSRIPMDLQAQAQAVPKLVATAVGEGAAFVVFWRYTTVVEEAGTGVTGLVTQSGERPAAQAFRVSAQMLNGVTAVESLNIRQGVQGYKFSKAGTSFYALWSQQPTNVDLPVSSPTISVTDISGRTTNASPKNVTIGPSPIFATVR